MSLKIVSWSWNIFDCFPCIGPTFNHPTYSTVSSSVKTSQKIYKDNHINDKILIFFNNMKQVKAYLANQFGFSETGKYILESLIKPKIHEIGIIIHDPFLECGKEFDPDYLLKLERYEDRIDYYVEFNSKVSLINNRLMRDSNCLLAVLDGGHQIDEGVASEIGYYAGIEQGPIFALRSDLRSGENIATSVNPQILGYIQHSKGVLVDGNNALERWFSEIQKWYHALI